MPNISVAVPHELEQAEAVARLKQYLEKVRDEYGGQVSDLSENWNEHQLDYQFRVMGFSASGTLSVEVESVRVDGKIPLAAMVFRSRIEETVREQLVRAVG